MGVVTRSVEKGDFVVTDEVDRELVELEQQYGINLLKEDLHWFEFRALLDGLTEQTQFIKVVQARLRDTSKLKGEEKTQAEKLKRYWKVPDDSAQEERDPHEIEAELLAKLNT